MTQYGEGRRSSYPIWKVGTDRLRNRSDPRNHPKRYCSRGVTGGFPPARSRETGHAAKPLTRGFSGNGGFGRYCRAVSPPL